MRMYFVVKRFFDIFFSLFLLIFLFPLIFIAFIVCSFETKSLGLFFQKRVGQHQRIFFIFKLKTMIDDPSSTHDVSIVNNPRITNSGMILRKLKIDELPQLFNILIGDMSFVGPRPDVPGYADKLPEDIKKIVLSVKPGITSPASIFFSDEEFILANVEDPIYYNDNVLFPEKTRLNVDYVNNISFLSDITCIFKTFMKVIC